MLITFIITVMAAVIIAEIFDISKEVSERQRLHAPTSSHPEYLRQRLGHKNKTCGGSGSIHRVVDG